MTEQEDHVNKQLEDIIKKLEIIKKLFLLNHGKDIHNYLYIERDITQNEKELIKEFQEENEEKGLNTQVVVYCEKPVPNTTNISDMYVTDYKYEPFNLGCLNHDSKKLFIHEDEEITREILESAFGK